MKEIYRKLDDSEYSKSAPIPVLENDTEFFLVVKPRIKKIKNNDIEIEKVESDGSVLWVAYREIQNDEYRKKRPSNPIVIIKILNKPKKIKLKLI